MLFSVGSAFSLLVLLPPCGSSGTGPRGSFKPPCPGESAHARGWARPQRAIPGPKAVPHPPWAAGLCCPRGALLLAAQLAVQPLPVPEAAQRSHALQDVGVQLPVGRQAPHGHPAARGRLQAGVRLMLPTPGRGETAEGARTRTRFFTRASAALVPVCAFPGEPRCPAPPPPQRLHPCLLP